MNKKIISLMLASVMLFSVSLEVFAATTYTTGKKYFNDLSINDATNIGDVLSLKIMQGDDLGYFNPNAYLTKAQAVTIIMNMMNKRNTYLYSLSNFKDVPAGHWASQTIAQAQSLGLANGDGNGYFYPDKEVNALELITMCLRIVGIGEALDQTGNWPSAHMQFVNNYNLISKYNKSVYDPITRIDAAGIVSDFLSANIWTKNTRTGQYEMQDDTISSKYLGIKTYRDCIITAVHRSDYELNVLYKDEDGEYTEELNDIRVPNDLDMDDYEVGMVVSLSVSGYTALKIDIQDEASTRVLFYDEVVDYDSDGSYIKVKVDGKTSKKLFNEYQLTAIVNGTTKTGYENKMATVKRFVENAISEQVDTGREDEDGDKIYDTVYADVSGRIVLDENDKIISIEINKFTDIMFIKSISSSKLTGYSSSTYSTYSSNTSTSLNLKNKDYEIKDIDGAELSLDDLEKDDWIIFNDDDPYFILKLDESVYGYIDEVYKDSSDDKENWYVTISGTDYSLNTKFCTSLPNKTSSSKYRFFLDQNGKIVGWKK